jgi:hypothetical protein
MSRTVRRALAFDAMEDRVVLSGGAGLAAAAAQVQRAPIPQVHRAKVGVSHIPLNGVVAGIPFGTVSQGGIAVTSFPLKGNLQSMGKVTGSLVLTETTIAPGRQPDLSNATLNFSGRRGGLQLKTAAAPRTRYIFIVTGGTGAYASAYGSGTAVISYNGKLHEYQIALRSSVH